MSASRPIDVLAIGAAHVDTICRLTFPVQAASVEGETRSYAGGAAFNVARHIASAGFRVALATPGSGALVEAEAREMDIELVPIPRAEATAPSYTAILDPHGNLVTACADMEAYRLADSDFVAALRKRFGRPRLVVTDVNLSQLTLQNIVLAFHPTPTAVMAVSPSKAPRVGMFAEYCRVIFAARAEAEVLRSRWDEFDAVGGASRSRNVVVTDGAGTIEVTEDRHTVSVPVPPAEVVDVTGAGDALAGATLVHLLRGKTLPSAVARAVPVARHAVGQLGPFTPCPDLVALREAA